MKFNIERKQENEMLLLFLVYPVRYSVGLLILLKIRQLARFFPD
jgi:hypothetical protein